MTLNIQQDTAITAGNYYYPNGSNPREDVVPDFASGGPPWIAGRDYTLVGTRGVCYANPDQAEGWNVYINGFTSGASGSFSPGVQSFVQTGLTIAISAGDEIVWQANPLNDNSELRVNLTIQLEPR